MQKSHAPLALTCPVLSPVKWIHCVSFSIQRVMYSAQCVVCSLQSAKSGVHHPLCYALPELQMTVVNALAAAATPQVHWNGQRKYPNFFPLEEMLVLACDPRWWGSRATVAAAGPR